jgi:Ca2+/Na+ antiporter
MFAKTLRPLLAFGFFVAPAAARFGDTAQAIGVKLKTVDTQSSVFAMVGTVINYFLGLIGLVVFFAILYAGVLILTAQGDSEKLTQARKVIVLAVAGGVLVMVSFALNAWIFKADFWGS